MIFYLEGPLGGELLERALYERGTDLSLVAMMKEQKQGVLLI
jgi:hypothetical protein